jgi:class 3 adenylate cyclase/tetratricopeptide (TPR) repeat protein
MKSILPGLIALLMCTFLFTGAISRESAEDLYISQADSLFDNENYELAIIQYQAYIISSKVSTVEEKETLAYCYDQIGVCCYVQDKYDEAIGSFQKALEIYIDLGDKASVANTLNNIGQNYKMRGNHDKAIEYFTQTISIDEELHNDDEISSTLNNIAMVYRAWGKYDTAIQTLERSLRLNNTLGDQTGISNTLNIIGLVYTDWKKYDQAILNLRESLRIGESIIDESGIATRLNNLARVYFYIKQYDSALFFFNKTLLIYQITNDMDQIALAFNNIGKVYLDQNKYGEASDYLSSALNIYNELGKEDEKSTVLANLSEISRLSGNEMEALRLLDSSTVIAEKRHLMSQLRKNYMYYSDLYYEMKDYKKSQEYLKKYTAIQESVFSEQVSKQLSDFQIKYETEKKENEIIQLRQNEVIQGLALKKQTIFRNSMVAVSALLFALAAMIFYGFQLKKKDNRIIEAAKAKSDQLLLNVLPAGVAQDLKEKGKTEPQLFDNATVCFVDIVNFTEKTSTIEPVTLINELNQIFTEFDKIIEKFGCERIKTIGDCYMAVSGLPDLNPRHAQAIVGSCLEMIRFMEARNEESTYKWEIRSGINSGEVIAGVVGVKKYIYDVFGDTINTASRMESNSEPMKINISESTYLLVKEEFKTEFRGELDVRGKGKLRMYFVKS